MSASVRRSITRTRSWQAWAGTVDELRKVGDIAGALFSERQTQVANELYPDIDDESRDSDADISAQFDLRYARQSRDGIVDSKRFEATLESGSDKVSGRVADILAEFDQRTVTAINYAGSFHTESTGLEKFSVVFTWDSDVKPAVSSADHGWTNKALAVLSEELDKRKIWWANVHKPRWRGPLFMLTFFAFYAAAALIVLHFTKSLPGAAIGARYCLNWSCVSVRPFRKTLSEDFS